MNFAGPEKLPISVVILTKNEEDVVGQAIASCRDHYDEVIVLDSFSDDTTVHVAQSAGAAVIQNAFKGYASQRNFALKQMPKRNDWLLFLDADEVVTDELTEELRSCLPELEAQGYGMAYMRRKDIFMSRWLRRSSGYPTWFGRLCHAPSVRVEREINEVYVCERPTKRLTGHLVHFPFAKGLSHWVDRHNRYSTAEAKELSSAHPMQVRALLSRDPGLRRKHMKALYMQVPCRPLVAFVYLYVLRCGFLDGAAGLRFAVLRSFYEFLIDLKAKEKAGSHSFGGMFK